MLNEQVRKALSKKGEYFYVLPTYRMVKTNIWDTLAKEHIPEEAILRKNEKDMTIYYRNGSIHRFMGCEDPDRLRGSNPIDVVFDEYSEEPEEVWEAIFQPVLRENKGTATFIYTPKGKNHSWKLLQQAKTDDEWYWSVKSVYDTNGMSEDEINKARERTPLALFQQEYECAFLEGASQFFRGVRDITYDSRLPLTMDGYFQVGVDLAKYNDYTVITPFNVNNFTAYPQDRFNLVDWPTQVSRIEAMSRRYNDAKVYIDSTGVGDPIVDALQSNGVNVSDDTAIKFSDKTRRDMLTNLAMLIENKKIRIPNDEGLINELESFRWEMSDSGRPKITVPSGVHDDRVFSLALAVYGQKDATPEYEEEEFSLYNTEYK